MNFMQGNYTVFGLNWLVSFSSSQINPYCSITVTTNSILLPNNIALYWHHIVTHSSFYRWFCLFSRFWLLGVMLGFLSGTMIKNPPASGKESKIDTGLIPEATKTPRGRHSNSTYAFAWESHGEEPGRLWVHRVPSDTAEATPCMQVQCCYKHLWRFLMDICFQFASIPVWKLLVICRIVLIFYKTDVDQNCIYHPFNDVYESCVSLYPCQHQLFKF